MVNSLEDPFSIVKEQVNTLMRIRYDHIPNPMSCMHVRVYREIQNNIQKIHDIYGTTQQLLNQPQISSSDAPARVIEETRKNISSLKQLIESVEYDMKDMDAALVNVETKAYKYPMEAKELPKRKEFIRMVHSSLIASGHNTHLALESLPFPCCSLLTLLVLFLSRQVKTK